MINADIECPQCGECIDLVDWTENYFTDRDNNLEWCSHCDEWFNVVIDFPRPSFNVMKDDNEKN